MPKLNQANQSAFEQADCRRQWGRYPLPDKTVAVSTGTHTFEAVTSDESIVGLGLVTKHPAPLALDQRLRISLRKEEMEGVVTAVTEQNDGSRRFSVRWETTTNGKTETSREQPFVAVNGFVVACQVVREAGTDAVKIRLWNGFEFDVASDKLILRTEETRRSELEALQGKAKLLARIYDMEPRNGSELLVDRILELEFLGSLI